MKTYTFSNPKNSKLTLLRHFPLENHAMDDASLSIVFTGLVFPEDIKVKSRERKKVQNGEIVHYGFQKTTFQVSYELVAKPDPKQEIDVAGNLRVKGEIGPSEEEKETWLNHAREERERLKNTKNGPDLLNVYDTYEDVYNRAFDSGSFCGTWHQGRMVESMARDTHEALLQDDKTINDPDKNYAPEESKETVKYNSRSIDVQQKLIITLSAMTGGQSALNPPGPNQISDEDLDAASQAIIAFENKVYEETGNNATAVVPMTKASVYQTVENPKEPEICLDNGKDPHEMFKYYKARLENEKNGANNAEPDRYGHESFFRAVLAESEQRNAETTVYSNGSVEGVIPDDGFELELFLQKEDKVTTDVVVRSILMPEPELDIDSENWSIEYRKELEDKLQNVSFFRQNVINLLRDGIGQIVLREVAKYEAVEI